MRGAIALALLLLATPAHARLIYRYEEREFSLAWLRWQLVPGDTIHCVNKSFNYEAPPYYLRCYLLDWNASGSPTFSVLTWHIAVVLGKEYDEHNQVIVYRGPWDLGGSLAARVGLTLWPDGFEHFEPNCPSQDHKTGWPRTLHPDSERALWYDWL